MNAAVTVNNLSIRLGPRTQALRDVSLTIPQGRITGIIGPSGAGKTTLIRSITGRLAVPKKKIVVLGQEAGSASLRSKVHYMPQELSVYTDLTVSENLHYFAQMLGQSRTEARQNMHDLLALSELLDQRNQLVETLSGGQKQRVSLAIALLGEPELLVLDEPTVGLDPVLRNTIWQLFTTIATTKRTTLIISSHAMDEAERCENLILLRDGQIIANSTPAELLQKTGTKSVEQAFLQLAGGQN